jgi:hypothetical protein
MLRQQCSLPFDGALQTCRFDERKRVTQIERMAISAMLPIAIARTFRSAESPTRLGPASLPAAVQDCEAAGATDGQTAEVLERSLCGIQFPRDVQQKTLLEGNHFRMPALAREVVALRGCDAAKDGFDVLPVHVLWHTTKSPSAIRRNVFQAESGTARITPSTALRKTSIPRPTSRTTAAGSRAQKRRWRCCPLRAFRASDMPWLIIRTRRRGKRRARVYERSDAGEERVCRSDKFTPKSFVSHSANVKRDAPDEVDRLPRIRHPRSSSRALGAEPPPWDPTWRIW